MQLLTVLDAARQLAVSDDQVRALIKSGRLRAVNVGLGNRPLWRLTAEAIDSFLAVRAVAVPPKTKASRRQTPPVTDFFPNR